MGLKIVWENPTPENEFMGPASHLLWDKMLQVARKVVRPDTEVTIRHLEKHYGGSSWKASGHGYPYLRMLNTASVVGHIIEAEREGYDAVMIGDAVDDGLLEARGVVTIPVTSVGESAFLLAQLLGRRFAVVALADFLIPLIEAKLNLYGLESRAIRNRPVRSADLTASILEACKGKPGRLIADFEKTALECVDDGADVVIAVCAHLGPALSLHGYHKVGDTGVPVVDATSAALKLSELLADLRESIGLSKSEGPTSLYCTPPYRLLDE